MHRESPIARVATAAAIALTLALTAVASAKAPPRRHTAPKISAQEVHQNNLIHRANVVANSAIAKSSRTASSLTALLADVIALQGAVRQIETTLASFTAGPASAHITGTGQLIQQTAGEPPATLFSRGAFTVIATCTSDQSGGHQLELIATSTFTNSLANGSVFGGLGGVDSKTLDIEDSSVEKTRDNAAVTLEAPDGEAVHLLYSDGVNAVGGDCFSTLVALN
jgi:hypothetical protein